MLVDLCMIRDINFLVYRYIFHCIFTCWKGKEGSVGVLFKGTEPIHEGWYSWPSHLSQAPSVNTITLGDRFQHTNFGDTNTQSIWSLKDNVWYLFHIIPQKRMSCKEKNYWNEYRKVWRSRIYSWTCM